jgi:hypothetical protein
MTKESERSSIINMSDLQLEMFLTRRASERCAQTTTNMIERLRPWLEANNFEVDPGDGYARQIRFITPGGLTGYPNMGVSLSHVPTRFAAAATPTEFMLVNADQDVLTYDEATGYYDTQRFEGDHDVKMELVRLYNIYSGSLPRGTPPLDTELDD